MDNLLTFCLRCILGVCACWMPFQLHAQTANAELFDLNDQEDMLIRLFDSDSLNDQNEVLWTPLTFGDQVMSNISDDDLIHTAFDTVLYFTTLGTNKAVAIFQTFHYINGEINACPTCGAQLSVAVFEDAGDGRWQILKFQKHFTTSGTYGMNGEVGLTQFGDETWCLRLEMHWVGQDTYGEYVTFYNLEDFQKVFQFTIHEDNTAALEFPDPERTYAFDKTIHFLPHVDTPSGWWDFDIVTRGTEQDNDVSRAIPANYVTRYEYDWDTERYSKACQ